MAGLNKESLIEMLILKPSNDIEVGFNMGIITILKKIVELAGGSGVEIETPELVNPDFKRLKDAAMYTLGSTLSVEGLLDEDVNEIFDWIRNKNKLPAVKLLKEKAGLGLKEAKDIIDTIA